MAEPRPVGLNPGSAIALSVTTGTCTDLFGLSGLTNKMGIRVTGRIQMSSHGKNSQPQRRPSGNADPPSTPLETTDWFLRPQSHAHGLVTWPRCDCEVTRLTFLTHQNLSRPGALPLQSHASGRLSLSPSQAARTPGFAGNPLLGAFRVCGRVDSNLGNSRMPSGALSWD